MDDSVDIGDGTYTEYTLLIYLSGSGSPAAKGKQKGVTKPSPGLLGGETIFYGNHLLGFEQCKAFLHPQSIHGIESSKCWQNDLSQVLLSSCFAGMCTLW